MASEAKSDVPELRTEIGGYRPHRNLRLIRLMLEPGLNRKEINN
jgi:hypothetical protein